MDIAIIVLGAPDTAGTRIGVKVARAAVTDGNIVAVGLRVEVAVGV